MNLHITFWKHFKTKQTLGDGGIQTLMEDPFGGYRPLVGYKQSQT